MVDAQKIVDKIKSGNNKVEAIVHKIKGTGHLDKAEKIVNKIK